MKRFSVSAFFPEVKPAHEAFQSCSFDASNMGHAVHRALLDIRARPALKGKRITEVRLTVKEINCAKTLFDAQ
jgi:hypothetical protein